MYALVDMKTLEIIATLSSEELKVVIGKCIIKNRVLDDYLTSHPIIGNCWVTEL